MNERSKKFSEISLTLIQFVRASVASATAGFESPVQKCIVIELLSESRGSDRIRFISLGISPAELL